MVTSYRNKSVSMMRHKLINLYTSFKFDETLRILSIAAGSFRGDWQGGRGGWGGGGGVVM